MKKEKKDNWESMANIEDTVRAEIGKPDDVYNIIIAKKQPKKFKSPDFVQIFQATSLMASGRINPSSLAVFFHLICKLAFSNHVGIDQKTISKEIKMGLSTVKKAIKELLTENMIISYQDPQDNRRNIYIMNPHMVWRGREESRIATIKKIDPSQMKLFDK